MGCVGVQIQGFEGKGRDPGEPAKNDLLRANRADSAAMARFRALESRDRNAVAIGCP
jgi:hypothetical protein